jgi:transposase
MSLEITGQPGIGPATSIKPKRAGGRPRREDVTLARVQELKAQGLSIRQIAAQVRAGYGTIRKILRETRSPAEASENPTPEAL